MIRVNGMPLENYVRTIANDVTRPVSLGAFFRGAIVEGQAYSFSQLHTMAESALGRQFTREQVRAAIKRLRNRGILGTKLLPLKTVDPTAAQGMTSLVFRTATMATEVPV